MIISNQAKVINGEYGPQTVAVEFTGQIMKLSTSNDIQQAE